MENFHCTHQRLGNQNKDVFKIYLLEDSAIYFPNRYVKTVDEFP